MKTPPLTLIGGVVAVGVAVGFSAVPVAVAEDTLVAKMEELTERKGFKDIDFGAICAQAGLPGDCRVIQAPPIVQDGTTTHSINVYSGANSKYVFFYEHNDQLAHAYLIDLQGKLQEVISGEHAHKPSGEPQ